MLFHDDCAQQKLLTKQEIHILEDVHDLFILFKEAITELSGIKL